LAQRVGVDASKRITFTLHDAVTMALGNNRDIEVERINVQVNEKLRRCAGYCRVWARRPEWPMAVAMLFESPATSR
jgi:hypothetical protein